MLFRKEDTEMSSVGANLESYFEEQLKLLYPDRTLPDVKAEETAPEPEPAPASASAAASPTDTAEAATQSPKTYSPEAPGAKGDAEPPNKSPPKEEPQLEEALEKAEGTEKTEESCNPENTPKQDNSKDQNG